MVLTGLLSWNAIVLLCLIESNVLFLLLMGISHPLDGLRAKMNVGTGKCCSVIPPLVLLASLGLSCPQIIEVNWLFELI